MTTCTVPKFTPGGLLLSKHLYKTDKSAAGATTTFDNTGIGRTAVGYIKVIEMGQPLARACTLMTKAQCRPSQPHACGDHPTLGKPADCDLL